MYQLIPRFGDLIGIKITRTTVLGRAPFVDKQVPSGSELVEITNLEVQPGMVSRNHVLIVKIGDELYALDLKSLNGTTLNNIKISTVEQTQLKHWDIICLGGARLALEGGMRNKRATQSVYAYIVVDTALVDELKSLLHRYSLQKKCSQAFKVQKASAIKIQALFRAYSQQATYQQAKACIKIQALFKAFSQQAKYQQAKVVSTDQQPAETQVFPESMESVPESMRSMEPSLCDFSMEREGVIHVNTDLQTPLPEGQMLPESPESPDPCDNPDFQEKAKKDSRTWEGAFGWDSSSESESGTESPVLRRRKRSRVARLVDSDSD